MLSKHNVVFNFLTDQGFVCVHQREVGALWSTHADIGEGSSCLHFILKNACACVCTRVCVSERGYLPHFIGIFSLYPSPHMHSIHTHTDNIHGCTCVHTQITHTQEHTHTHLIGKYSPPLLGWVTHRDFLLAVSLPPRGTLPFGLYRGPEHLVTHGLLVGFKGGLTSPARLLTEQRPGLKWGICDGPWRGCSWRRLPGSLRNSPSPLFCCRSQISVGKSNRIMTMVRKENLKIQRP